jgi:hypothetical protein
MKTGSSLDKKPWFEIARISLHPNGSLAALSKAVAPDARRPLAIAALQDLRCSM